jgi:opacity protein-like surface antigen
MQRADRVGLWADTATPPPGTNWWLDPYVSFGVAQARTSVAGIGAGFYAKDIESAFGFTGSVGASIPILPELKFGVEYRYFNVQDFSVNIPGKVDVSSQGHIVTFGLTYVPSIGQLQRALGR